MIVDVVVVAMIAVMTAFGYRSGLLKAGCSWAGLIGGLALAVPLVGLIGRRIDSPAWRLGLIVGLLVLIANAGYVGGMLLGERLKSRVWRPWARGLDRAFGAIASFALSTVLVWMLAVPLGSSAIPGVAQAVRSSALLPRIDATMPDAVRSLNSAIDGLVRSQGLPDVLGPLQETDVADVGQPDPATEGDPEVALASRSVVKVVGQAPQCNRIVDGSGFVYAPNRVATNAHVVAGTSSLTVELGSREYDATVVYADENLDLAVLAVDSLSAQPLALDTAGQPAGADAVVIGYPGGGALDYAAAKVRAEASVTGPAFRGDELVTRQVVMLRGSVVPGNSGGPVVDLDGKVVGVVFGAAADEPEVGYALTAASVADELAAAEHATSKVVTGACYP